MGCQTGWYPQAGAAAAWGLGALVFGGRYEEASYSRVELICGAPG